ncbi:response regulator receiver and SARP domain protein [Lacrimispora xylanisolvens]|uniref:Stage 0 sporulation protein A homolog n=1 Tax=Lacrimispora xylanisolvens TaxID=384636 RepID=A0A2S6HTG1_9FIRM|nr:response regulator [Hungatella xylanolytica]MBE5990283.1 response regulator [Paenibacillaceae bacterium]PPK80958.1 response regulator receiver and SARP domain protein [Hungatella xylanolytica]
MRAIIVDDEELARCRLTILLEEIQEITLCGSFATALDALKYIDENPVDVIFLDITMPEMDGMEFANLLIDKKSSASVVFVTGYGEYAVEAFELEAVDYLLKPIKRDRLVKTIDRLARKNYREVQQLYIKCFGGFWVLVQDEGGQAISWRSPKVEELFAYLVCKVSVSRDEIADTLWEGFPLDKAMKNLNSTVYYVRKALQQFGMEECLITTRKQISLDTKRIYCDLYEFQQMQNLAWKTEKEMERLKELYRGELFQGKTYEWSFPKAHTLEKNMISNLLKAGELREDQKRTEDAERLYLHALELDPYHEGASDKLLDFYNRTGRKKKEKQLRKEIGLLLSDEVPHPLLFLKKHY